MRVISPCSPAVFEEDDRGCVINHKQGARVIANYPPSALFAKTDAQQCRANCTTHREFKLECTVIVNNVLPMNLYFLNYR